MKQATRAAILAAGEAVFAERGFSNARMEEIAERAGVSVGTLYNYFADRQTLLDAVLDAAAQELVSRLEEGLAPITAPFVRQLEGLLSISVKQIEAHLSLYSILLEEELESGRCGNRRKKPMFKAIYLAIEKLVEQGVGQGVLRAEDAALYPAMLVGMMRGLFVRKLCHGDARPLSGQIVPLVHFFLEGAARRPS